MLSIAREKTKAVDGGTMDGGADATTKKDKEEIIRKYREKKRRDRKKKKKKRQSGGGDGGNYKRNSSTARDSGKKGGNNVNSSTRSVSVCGGSRSRSNNNSFIPGPLRGLLQCGNLGAVVVDDKENIRNGKSSPPAGTKIGDRVRSVKMTSQRIFAEAQSVAREVIEAIPRTIDDFISDTDDSDSSSCSSDDCDRVRRRRRRGQVRRSRSRNEKPGTNSMKPQKRSKGGGGGGQSDSIMDAFESGLEEARQRIASASEADFSSGSYWDDDSDSVFSSLGSDDNSCSSASSSRSNDKELKKTIKTSRRQHDRSKISVNKPFKGGVADMRRKEV